MPRGLTGISGLYDFFFPPSFAQIGDQLLCFCHTKKSQRKKKSLSNSTCKHDNKQKRTKNIVESFINFHFPSDIFPGTHALVFNLKLKQLFLERENNNNSNLINLLDASYMIIIKFPSPKSMTHFECSKSLPSNHFP